MAYNILIVDDSSLTRTVMERTVRMCGVEINEIRTAEHGQAALEVLESFWPDIVFCDINMPVMDGLQFVQAMKSSDEWHDLPIVIVSTEGSETRIDELRRTGVHGYIRKPFAPEEVASMIQQVLGAKTNAS